MEENSEIEIRTNNENLIRSRVIKNNHCLTGLVTVTGLEGVVCTDV